jgi:hypothetical protein
LPAVCALVALNIALPVDDREELIVEVDNDERVKLVVPAAVTAAAAIACAWVPKVDCETDTVCPVDVVTVCVVRLTLAVPDWVVVAGAAVTTCFGTEVVTVVVPVDAVDVPDDVGVGVPPDELPVSLSLIVPEEPPEDVPPPPDEPPEPDCEELLGDSFEEEDPPFDWDELLELPF